MYKIDMPIIYDYLYEVKYLVDLQVKLLIWSILNLLHILTHINLSYSIIDIDWC